MPEVNQERPTTTLNSWTAKQYCQEHGVTAISNVKISVNDNPYVTFYMKGNVENIYFSRKAEAVVQPQKDMSPSQLGMKNLGIYHFRYDDDQTERIKITLFSGESVDEIFS
jgi:hypothetical protein